MALIPERLYKQLTDEERLEVNEALAGLRRLNEVECPNCGAPCDIKLQGKLTLTPAGREMRRQLLQQQLQRELLTREFPARVVDINDLAGRWNVPL